MTRHVPLRVAMVIQRFRPLFSGQGDQVELLCRVLARRGLAPTIVTSAYAEPSEVEDCEGYQVVRLRSDLHWQAGRRSPSRVHGPVFGARTLKFLFGHGGFDVVHVHALTDALYTSWMWCCLKHRPLVFEMTLVGTDDPMALDASRNHFSGTRRAIFRRCDGYVAISPALEHKYLEAGLSRRKLRLVPQGVDVTRYRPVDDRAARRASLGLPIPGPLLMFVGSLVHRKGIDVLFNAWARIHEAMPGAHLALVGRNQFVDDQPAQDYLRDRKALLPRDAAGHVHELGLRADVAELLGAADLFVFPSRREGFGTVMVEAMACGLPSVVTVLPGITDFIFGQRGTTGVVVGQEDHGAIAAEVLSLLSDRDRARTMGAAARQRAVERFDIERIADQYVDYYQELVAGTRDGRLVD